MQPCCSLSLSLQFGPQTNFGKAECLSTHTTNFGASFFVPPNTINFNTVFDKFANLGDNAAVFSTVIVVLCLYFIPLLFLRRLDKKDIVRVSHDPLMIVYNMIGGGIICLGHLCKQKLQFL